MSEKKKFEKWYKAEKKNGLIDFKIELSPNANANDEESIYRELNQVNHLLETNQILKHEDIF